MLKENSKDFRVFLSPWKRRFHFLITHNIRRLVILCAHLRQGNRHIQRKDLDELQPHHKTHVSVINSNGKVSTMVLVDIIILGPYVVCSRHKKSGLKQHAEKKLSWIVMEILSCVNCITIVFMQAQKIYISKILLCCSF